MKKLWGRVGVSIKMTDYEYNEFIEAYHEDKVKAYEMLEFSFMSGSAKLDGEAYFPDNVDDNIDMEFNF